MREIQDLTEWRNIFFQWIWKLSAVKVNNSQIYIQIKSNCNQIPLCFCVFETWQADSKFMLLFSHSVMSTSLRPMDYSTGLPLHHQLLELTQTHVHWVSDAIQPSHPLSSPSLHAFNLSHHPFKSQLFASGGQSIEVSVSASVLPMNIQDWSPLEWTGWISLLSKGISRGFSNTTVQKHQFFNTQLSL